MSTPDRISRNGRPIVRFHVMANPIGPLCNLDCTYCYYLSKQNLLRSGDDWRVSDRVLEEFVKQYIQGHNCEEVIFSWQGGEPMLMGLGFFRRVLELERKYVPPDVRVENDLQTNGVLLDDEWCEFLRDTRFLVGLSIDGPKDLHDKYRVFRNGQPTFQRVFAASKLLRKHGVRFNTLTAVNRANAVEPLRVYRFLRDEVRSERMQFIPIVEPKTFRAVAPGYWDPSSLPKLGSPRTRPASPDSVVTEWSVDPIDYGNFLIAVFDEWYKHDVGKHFVYLFEAAVAQWMGMEAPLCCLASTCGMALALEHDGDIFACDHYVYPEYRRGNIMNQSLVTMVFSPEQARFGLAKARSLPPYCRSCAYLFACNGECPKNRLLRTPQGEPGLNYLCSGLKMYFRHIDPYIRSIVHDLGEAGNSG
jgi:uncharacterized protein